MSTKCDFFGRPIQKGDVFAYAMRMCNSSEIGVGIVVDPGSDQTPVSAWMIKNTWGRGAKLNDRISKIIGRTNMVIINRDTVPDDLLRQLEAKQ